MHWRVWVNWEKFTRVRKGHTISSTIWASQHRGVCMYSCPSPATLHMVLYMYLINLWHNLAKTFHTTNDFLFPLDFTSCMWKLFADYNNTWQTFCMLPCCCGTVTKYAALAFSEVHTGKAKSAAAIPIQSSPSHSTHTEQWAQDSEGTVGSLGRGTIEGQLGRTEVS